MAPRDISHIQAIVSKYKNTPSLYQGHFSEKGFWLTRYPSGLAFSYLPFYFVGEYCARVKEHPKDGYSYPYQRSFLLGHLFYVMLSILLLHYLLRHFFSDKMATLIVLLITIGTNYYSQATLAIGMSHSFLFLLNTLILIMTIKWHSKKSYLNTILLSIFIGWAALCRPVEIVAIFIPLLWGVHSLKSLKQNWMALFTIYKSQTFIAISLLFLFGMPQFLYWEATTGHFFVNSYNNPAEALEPWRPFFLEVLFSYRKGWLLYTPIMIFAILGFIWMYKHNRKIFIALLAYFVLNLWLVASWNNWWYAESFSQRALVQSYPIMAVALGYFLQYNHRTWIQKSGLAVLFIFLVTLNQFQIWQIKKGILHGSRMTKDYYWAIFGKTSIDPKTKDFLLIERKGLSKEKIEHPENYQVSTIHFEDYESFENLELLSDSIYHNGKRAIRLDEKHIYAPKFSIPYEEIVKEDQDHAWLKVTAWIYCASPVSQLKPCLFANFSYKGKAYKWKGFNLQKEDIPTHQWTKVEMVYLTPNVIRRPTDKFESSFWLIGKGDFYIDDFQVELYSLR